jgi:hypothetical protein
MHHLFIIFFLLASPLFTEAPAQQVEQIVQPSIAISKSTSLCDEPLSIEIEGLKPGIRASLKAEALDERNQKWISQAVFQSDSQGNISLAKQAPVEGDYQHVDSMGLFRFMRPESGKTMPYRMPATGMAVRFTLEVEGNPISTAECLRLRKLPDVERISVRENGIIGALFLPASKKPLPCIITLSGSSGGLSETRSQILASRGFAVLALGYFAV